MSNSEIRQVSTGKLLKSRETVEVDQELVRMGESDPVSERGMPREDERVTCLHCRCKRPCTESGRKLGGGVPGGEEGDNEKN